MRRVLGIGDAEVAAKGRDARVAQRAALVDRAAAAAEAVDLSVAVLQLAHAVAQCELAPPEQRAQRVEIIGEQSLLVARKRRLELGAHFWEVHFHWSACTLENSFSSAWLKAAGSSLLMVWLVRGRTSSAAPGTVRFSITLPSRQAASSSPTMTRSGTASFFRSAAMSHSVGRLSCRCSMVRAWPSAECSLIQRRNSSQPRGSLAL